VQFAVNDCAKENIVINVQQRADDPHVFTRALVHVSIECVVNIYKFKQNVYLVMFGLHLKCQSCTRGHESFSLCDVLSVCLAL